MLLLHVITLDGLRLVLDSAHNFQLDAIGVLRIFIREVFVFFPFYFSFLFLYYIHFFLSKKKKKKIPTEKDAYTVRELHGIDRSGTRAFK